MSNTINPPLRSAHYLRKIAPVIDENTFGDVTIDDFVYSVGLSNDVHVKIAEYGPSLGYYRSTSGAVFIYQSEIERYAFGRGYKKALHSDVLVEFTSPSSIESVGFEAGMFHKFQVATQYSQGFSQGFTLGQAGIKLSVNMINEAKAIGEENARGMVDGHFVGEAK